MDDEAFFTDDIIKGKSVMGYSPVGGSGGQNELLRAGANKVFFFSFFPLF